jgi:16S rRNA (uracil1498-N3)-methyltransferase
MPVHDFTSQRLFVPDDLAAGRELSLGKEQANYLLNVLRLAVGARSSCSMAAMARGFSELVQASRKGVVLRVDTQERPQEDGPDLVYLFAPLKRARLDFMVQKAVELGVSHLQPVITTHTQVDRVKTDRMRANVIEAAEQCGILRLPQVAEPVKLSAALAALEPQRVLVFCDERAAQAGAIEPLGAVAPGTPMAVLIGPEGGFSDRERTEIAAHPGAISVSLGPRIMRADTAAVAALTLVNATVGDWRPSAAT